MDFCLVHNSYWRSLFARSDEYQTLGGFVMMQMGRVPTAGDRFEWGRHRIEVVDMDGNRVDKLLVQTLPEEVQESE